MQTRSTVCAFFLSIPVGIAVPGALALAIEACLYVAAVLEPVRAWLEARFRPPALAAWMTASALVPYCVYAIPTGTFDLGLCIVLGVAAFAVSFWFVVFPRRPAVDVLFVVFVAAVLLSPLFAAIFAPPAPRLALGILGQLAWTRLAFLAALSIARMEVKGVGLLPDRREWAAGFVNFVLFLPVGVLLGWALHFAAFRLKPMPWWQTLGIAAGTFLGMLWVVALREEFFFRGLLQEWLERWLRSGWLGLAAASALFGLVHLTFRDFPNWRFAILAAAAGLFYGRAYQTTRSIRAAMVTHALVNTVWKVLASG
jgi:membrane protease YdiL (CAAX protease family)